MLQHLIIRLSLHFLSGGRLQEVKNKGKFQNFSCKVVAVAYERWPLTRGSKYSGFTEKLLVFWKTGR